MCCVSSLISNKWCNQYHLRISSKNKIWFNKVFKKLLKPELVLSVGEKQSIVWLKQPTQFLRQLSINSWRAFWNRHEKNNSKHFLIKRFVFLKERKAAFLFCDQDHSILLHQELKYDWFWSCALTKIDTSLIWSSD